VRDEDEIFKFESRCDWRGDNRLCDDGASRSVVAGGLRAGWWQANSDTAIYAAEENDHRAQADNTAQEEFAARRAARSPNRETARAAD